MALAACLAAPWAAATVAPLAIAPAVAVAQDEGDEEKPKEEKSYLVFLAEALGPGFLKVFLAIKRQECARFSAEVTELDRSWYLHTA